MFFNSWPFLAFILPVLGIYYTLSRRLQNDWLLLASYAFYAAWDWRFLSLIWISTAVDYLVGRGLHDREDPTSRRHLLCISLVCNLGLLGFFKYFNFFVDSTATLIEAFGMQAHLPLLKVMLPVGISFYTFQTMSYTIDIYRRKLEPTRDFAAFACFVAFFPQLVAGPIERASRLLPQFEARRVVTSQMFASGCWLILIGLFKKCVIADPVSIYVERAFANADTASAGLLLLGIYLFSFQIYCDFSGYSSIARGLSRLLGFELMVNFRQPYFSLSVTEFWRRWHISLSTWLRDYLYIPLGGNRGGRFLTYRNLMLTMLLGGLWHGASWTFVIWGGLHGMYLAVHRMFRSSVKTAAPIRFTNRRTACRSAIQVIVVFHLVALTWIFFRAADLSTALNYLSGIASFRSGPLDLKMLMAFGLAASAVLLLDWSQYQTDDGSEWICRMPWMVRGVVAAVMLLLIAFLSPAYDVPFVYFQF